MLDNIAKNSILYDFYGALLRPQQREIFRLYYEDNLSLGEIAKEYGLTRQGIHETVKRGEKKLADYEAELGLADKFKRDEKIIEELKAQIRQLISEKKTDIDLIAKLRAIEDKIAGL
jgi:predicted DNA-binding protein YlxM (UPF0122 family)